MTNSNKITLSPIQEERLLREISEEMGRGDATDFVVKVKGDLEYISQVMEIIKDVSPKSSTRSETEKYFQIYSSWESNFLESFQDHEGISPFILGNLVRIYREAFLKGLEHDSILIRDKGGFSPQVIAQLFKESYPHGARGDGLLFIFDHINDIQRIRDEIEAREELLMDPYLKNSSMKPNSTPGMHTRIFVKTLKQTLMTLDQS